MRIPDALTLSRQWAGVEVRRFGFWAVFSGGASSVFEDHGAWGGARFPVNGAFNAGMLRPFINADNPDSQFLNCSNIHRWLL